MNTEKKAKKEKAMRYLALSCLILLAACVPEAPTALRVHEIEFYQGEHSRRFSYFYGAPTTITIGATTLELSEGALEHDMAVPSALLVNGRPNRNQALGMIDPLPFSVQRAPLSTDLLVRTAAETGPIVYYDGRLWFDLLASAQPGFNTRVVPRQRVDGLRGLGQLTVAEADMLQELLEQVGAVTVAVLPRSFTPPQQVAGAEVDEYRRTALVVQVGLGTDEGAARPTVIDTSWDVLASGNQAAGGEEAEYLIARSPEGLLTLWNRAYGTQLSPPPLPAIDFRRESVIAIFSGQRPTGGYSLNVQDVRLEDGGLIIDIVQTRPAPDAMVTQVLTHPWAMVRVSRPDLNVAWIRDARANELVGAAQPLGR
jgi:hypothetical protein